MKKLFEATMKQLFAVILLAFVAAVAHAKPFPDDNADNFTKAELDAKVGAPTFTIDVKWLRTYGLPEVRDGTCYIAVQEVFDRDSLLEPIGSQLQRCVELGAKVVNDHPIEGARRINVHVVEGSIMHDPFAVTKIIEKVYGSPKLAMGSALSVGIRRPSGGKAMLIGGAYFEHGDTCSVIGFVHKLGHEVKHCFDGEFHDRGWNWLPVRK